MRRLVVLALLLGMASAAARDKSHKFQGWYHGYFEQYAIAEVPEDAAEHILVIGYVKKPGTIKAREKLTVTKAIEECGGFRDWADHNHIGVWKNMRAAL